MAALDRRLVRRTRAVRPLLALDAALGTLVAVPVVAQAVLLAAVVARSFDGAPPASGLLVALVVAFAFRGLLGWGMEVAGRRAAADVLSELRAALVMRRLHAAPLATDGASSAEVTTLGVQGVDALEGYFARYLPQVVLACTVPLAVLGWTAATDLPSAAIMLLTLPLVPVFGWLVGRFTAQRSRERLAALQQLSARFLDVVRGLPTLAAYGRAARQPALMEDVGERYRATTMSTLRAAFLSGAVLELAATLGVALVAVSVGLRLVAGDLALEPGLTVLVLAPELYVPLRRLGAEHHAAADGAAVAERVFAILDAPAEVARGGALVAPRPAVAPIRFEGVCFAYPGRPGAVLAGLDLELRPGETVALVGESGAGKSTVAALLLGLLAPAEGRIRAGDVDLAACDVAAWRRQVAWVPQRPALVRATLADNIRLGDPRASEARVRRAARLAGADAVARALPDGYATVIGDGARPLSPGERRRVAIARAFLRDAPLVVLDEPTADLDRRSADAVADALARLRRGRTTLVIAHRPELAAGADRVVVLAGGRATAGAAVPEAA